jgi:hypothetical protein
MNNTNWQRKLVSVNTGLNRTALLAAPPVRPHGAVDVAS